MSVFVDTNILVYAHDLDADTRHTAARRAVADLWQTPGEAWLSVQVLQEFYVTLVRRGVAAAEATRAVEDYAGWQVVPSDVSLVLAGVRASQRWQISLWDGLIVEAARRAGASELWSEDLNAGQDYGGVVVVNPLAA